MEMPDVKKQRRGSGKRSTAIAKLMSKSDSVEVPENEDESAAPNWTVGVSAEAAAATTRANHVTASTSDRGEQVEKNTDPMQTDPDDAPNPQTRHNAPVSDDIAPDAAAIDGIDPTFFSALPDEMHSDV